MSPDEAGPPAVGPFSGSKDVANNVEAKRKFYGDLLSDIDVKTDELVPEGVFPSSVANDYLDYAKTLKPVGEEKKIIPRVLEEAQNMRQNARKCAKMQKNAQKCTKKISTKCKESKKNQNLQKIRLLGCFELNIFYCKCAKRKKKSRIFS